MIGFRRHRLVAADAEKLPVLDLAHGRGAGLVEMNSALLAAVGRVGACHLGCPFFVR